MQRGDQMSSGYIAVLLFVVAVIIGLVILGRYASNVKQDLDAPVTAGVGVRGVIEVSAAAAGQLRGSARSPFHQAVRGRRACTDRTSADAAHDGFVGKEVSLALAEAAAQITERYGATWVVLVDASEDGASAYSVSLEAPLAGLHTGRPYTGL